jgi:hypothetical protein
MSVTVEQKEKVEAIRDEYMGYLLCTDEADREKAENAVDRIYSLCRIPAPKYHVWADNPTEAQTMLEMLTKLAQATNFKTLESQVDLPSVAYLIEGLPEDIRQHWFTFRGSVEVILFTRFGSAFVGSGRRSYGYDYEASNFVTNTTSVLSTRIGTWEGQTRWPSIPDNSSSNYYYHNTAKPFVMGSFASETMAQARALQAIGEYKWEASDEYLDLLDTLVKSGGRWYPFENIVVHCERPLAVSFDAQNRFHCETGPALHYRGDHMPAYYLQGRAVTKKLVEGRDKLTAKDVLAEGNQEVRRLMLDVIGIEKFLKEVGGKAIKSDEYGTLWVCEEYQESTRWTRPGRSNGYQAQQIFESLTIVEVVNKTPEPDGTFRHYFLRVPPRYKTPKGAVAWTFSQRKIDYNPVIET